MSDGHTDVNCCLPLAWLFTGLPLFAGWSVLLTTNLQLALVAVYICRGAAPAWHLSHVEVSNHSTGARAVFYANAWLDVKLGTTTLLLKAGSADAQSTARKKWKLSVQTRCVRH
jgi:hypothetical protein